MIDSTRTDIPARLDRLPWSAWHWKVVIALGVSWLLDGLEVTVVGSLGPALQRPDTLGLSAGQIGWAASAYIGGAVLGALYFGRLADKLGRKRMFLVTLVVYLVATVMTAFTWDIASFAFCRFLTGFGIGGEYAAINSAIDELIPARLRGRVDLAINGTFWIGAAMGAGLSIILLHPGFIGPEWGWRIAFGLGGILAFAILLVRYRPRAIFGLTLMASQAFFYNAIFFTYALVLARFYGVPDERVGYYIFPFAIGNFLGPLLLGHLFDSVGRRAMIATTYALAGIGLLITGYAFSQEWLTATSQALAWSAIFFVASAAASSAYLTVSEVFPLEMRAISISLFYAAGTALGGFVGPPLYGAMIESGSRSALFGAYAFAAVLMLVAALVTLFLGVDAERRPLEQVCTPLGCEPLARATPSAE